MNWTISPTTAAVVAKAAKELTEKKFKYHDVNPSLVEISRDTANMNARFIGAI